MTFWTVLLAVAELGLLLSGLYLLFLTLAGLRHRPAPKAAPGPQHRFAILIPAHNEEGILPDLLGSLRRMSYPPGLFDILVVADNCTDATAAVGRSLGATVFERRDPVLRGKGFALRWLLEQMRNPSFPPGSKEGSGEILANREYDAYVFLDADTTVSANFLSVMDRRFQQGSQVVQAYYTVADPLRTPASALRFIALTLKHYARPRGRAVLGLSCGLFGTGMGFKQALLDAHGWNAFTLAEDIEYFLQLTGEGVKVDFAPDAVVWGHMPATLKDARSQNLRWEKGRWQMAWRYGPRLLLKGLLRRDARMLDAIAEQAIPPLSINMALALAFLLGAGLVGNLWLVLLAVASVAALLAHVFIGLASARAPLQVYRALIHAPGYILWKLALYLVALLPGKGEWVRTQRS